MVRLSAQGAENSALKERQAKLDKDQQVSPPSSSSFFAVDLCQCSANYTPFIFRRPLWTSIILVGMHNLGE